MIYTRWGHEVEIIENNGKQRIDVDLPCLTLVRLRFIDEGDEGYTRFRFAEHLKADEGAKEIFKAVEAAEKRRLEVTPLIGAIKEAM